MDEWASYLARWNKTLTAVSELRNSCWVLINLGDLGKGVGCGWVWLDNQGGLLGGGGPRR